MAACSEGDFFEEHREDLFKTKTKEMDVNYKMVHWNPFYIIFQRKKHCVWSMSSYLRFYYQYLTTEEFKCMWSCSHSDTLPCYVSSKESFLFWLTAFLPFRQIQCYSTSISSKRLIEGEAVGSGKMTSFFLHVAGRRWGLLACPEGKQFLLAFSLVYFISLLSHVKIHNRWLIMCLT